MLIANKKLKAGVRKILFPFVVLVGLGDFLLQTYNRSISFGTGNSGISFGLFPESGFAVQLFLVISMLLGILILKRNNKEVNYALFFVLIGGVVNLTQKIIFSNVWDYLAFPLLPFRNNLADVLIFFGVIYYIYGELS